MEMRLGKTLVTIRRVKLTGARNVLVIAPFSAWNGWREDLRDEGIALTEILGTGEQRRKQISAGLSGWVITNPQIWKSAPGIKDIPWDVRIMDESTFMKSPTTKTARFFNSWGTEKLLLDFRLTGTPDPESPLNYYSQQPRIWGEKNYWEWRSKWFVPGPFHKWKLNPEKSVAFHAHLSRHAFYLTRGDVGLGGEKIRAVRRVEMPAKVRAQYKKLVKEFLFDQTGEQYETIIAGVKYSWIRRLCSGVAPGPDGTVLEVWDGKIEELVTLLRGELRGQPVVVWAHFQEELARIYRHLRNIAPCAVIYGGTPVKKRDEYVAKFQAGKLRYIIAQPVTLQYGKDLSRADTEIYFSSPESYEVRFQSEDRIISGAKNAAALIIDLVAHGTIEETILENVLEKRSRVQTSKAIIHKLRGGFK